MTADYGLYLHVPFCPSRCGYCDFHREIYRANLVDKYLDALAAEFSVRVKSPPRTIYIGGGTPSTLNYEQLEKLLSWFDDFDLHAVEEFTFEANPGTLNIGKLILLRDAGVSRFSLGVQSFSARGLQTLGRSHDVRAARFAIALLQELGLDFSLDLIFGWSGQTEKEWRDDLAIAIASGAEHLSCYGLTYAEGTPLYERRQRGEITPLNEDEELRLFEITEEVLSAAGLARYEVSNFARAGKEAKHNVNYWQGGEYVGIGAGAFSFIGGARFGNCDRPRDYIGKMKRGENPIETCERLSPEKRARETGVIWLRMKAGIDCAEFIRRTGFDPANLWRNELPKLLADGWLESHAGFLRLTGRALPLMDSVLVELV